MDDEDRRAEVAELLQVFLRDTADTVAVLDDDGTFLSFTTGTTFVGRPPQEIVGRKVSEVAPPDIAALILAGLRAAKLDGPAVVFEHKRPSPSGPRDVLARVIRKRDGTLLTHIKDVTDERRAELEAREHHERYMLLARATTNAVFDWGAVRDDVIWNEQLLHTFGYPFKRTTLEWWKERIHPADQQETSKSVQEAIADPRVEIWTGEYRFLCANGRYRDVFDRAIMLRDDTGRAVRVIGSMLDITERKRMQAKLERTERIVAAGTLAASVGHEMAGPLNYLLGNIELAREALASGAEGTARALQLLEDAKLGGDRLSAVLNEVGAMNGEDVPRAVLDLNDVVLAAKKMLDPALLERARIDVVERRPALVDGSAHRLGQVMTNVLNNALQAIDDEAARAGSGEVRVTLRVEGTTVFVDVEDNGRGLSSEEAEHIFDPLFTTRRQRGGTGLGLAVCHAVVTAHRGTIEVSPRASKGTAIRIALPGSREPHAAELTPTSAAPTSSASPGAPPVRRVLVVDDDELTLLLVESILAPHKVTTAKSGEDALVELAKHEFDVVLSDVEMPSFDGMKLREAVERLGRPIKFAFLTAADELRLASAPYLKKPFSPETLRRFVAEL